MPTFHATIERRLLVNFRADPAVAASVLPLGLEPRLVDGAAVVGMCLIRLGPLRSGGLPVMRRSENVAHRVAVWLDGRPAVYIPRRDTTATTAAVLSRWTAAGREHRARAVVREEADGWDITLCSRDGVVAVTAEPSATMMPGSVFADVERATEFFVDARCGLRPPTRRSEWRSVRLDLVGVSSWPMRVLDARSTWLERAFPRGSIELDSGLAMTAANSTWRAVTHLCPDGELAVDRSETEGAS